MKTCKTCKNLEVVVNGSGVFRYCGIKEDPQTGRKLMVKNNSTACELYRAKSK